MKEKILAFLPGDHPGQALLHYENCVISTNDSLKALAAQGAPEGTTMVAAMQTGGKGRMGRSFHSPDQKGVYLSFLLRPNCNPQELMHLTCAAAVAMHRAILKTCGISVQVKWINDLICNQKKLGGILTEMSIHPGTAVVDYAIIGVGINCLQKEEDFPCELQKIATSLLIVSGKPIDPANLASNMIAELWNLKQTLFAQKSAIMDLYKALCITLGAEVKLLSANNEQTAKAVDINDNGALLVKFPDGTQKEVSSGEVQVRGLYGYT